MTEHTYRRTSRPDGSYRAACSCGAVTYTFTQADADAWHADHAARTPEDTHA